MRWIADECVAAPLVRLLRGGGHDVFHVCDVAPGIMDTDVIQFACDEERLLLTEDKDFGELIFRRQMLVAGIVLLRIDATKEAVVWARLSAAIDRLGKELFGHYTVIEEQRLRSRQIAPPLGCFVACGSSQ